ncbi:MAG TPA: hypothetical protein VFV68_05160 [Agriterribacter sp.]|nr:hypothetical protein [Agriterribacter sp.]
MNKQDQSVHTALWFSKVLRWALGLLFIGVGVFYYHEGGWPAILFGLIFFATGFLRPKRCLQEGCELPDTNTKNQLRDTQQ